MLFFTVYIFVCLFWGLYIRIKQDGLHTFTSVLFSILFTPIIGTFVYKFLFEEEVKEKRENARRISEVRKAEREAIEKYRTRRLMDIESHALKRMSEKKIPLSKTTPDINNPE